MVILMFEGIPYDAKGYTNEIPYYAQGLASHDWTPHEDIFCIWLIT